MTRIVDVFIINEASNPIIIHQAHPPSSFGMIYFEGPFVLVDLIKRLGEGINIQMGSQRIKIMTTIGGEGAMGTYALASASTSAPAGESTLSPYVTATGLFSVPHEFLQ